MSPPSTMSIQYEYTHGFNKSNRTGLLTTVFALQGTIYRLKQDGGYNCKGKRFPCVSMIRFIFGLFLVYFRLFLIHSLSISFLCVLIKQFSYQQIAAYLHNIAQAFVHSWHEFTPWARR